MESYVMISGATGGLGKAFAVECAARGYSVYLTDLSAAALETLAEALESSYGVPIKWQSCDLTDSGQRAALFDSVQAEGTRFWALINVAGTDHEGAFHEQSREHIRTIVRLNVEGAVEMAHAMLGLRDPAATFRMINVASMAAFSPMPYKATYAASKRFLLDFSLALGAELSSASHGVTVTALCPAGLPTNQGSLAGIAAQGWWGHITTQNIGSVAADTLDAALKGKQVYIPGWINRCLIAMGRLVPPVLAARLVGRRWKTVQHYPAAVPGTQIAPVPQVARA